MNRVEISGGLTRKPEMRSVGKRGAKVCDFTVAVNGTRYDSERREQAVKTAYISVNAWGWLGEEIMAMRLDKGDEVHVLGELDQTSVEKEDGTKDQKTRVTAMVVSPVRRRRPPQAPAAADGRPLEHLVPSPKAHPNQDAPPHLEPPPGYDDDEEPF